MAADSKSPLRLLSPEGSRTFHSPIVRQQPVYDRNHLLLRNHFHRLLNAPLLEPDQADPLPAGAVLLSLSGHPGHRSEHLYEHSDLLPVPGLSALM